MMIVKIRPSKLLMLMSNSGNPQVRPFPWKCGQCGQRDVYPTVGEYTTDVVHDGHTYTLTISNLRTFQCRNCADVVLDAQANRRISLAFRQQAGLLTPEEIQQNRESLNLTQEELASYLGVEMSLLLRWETGVQIQPRSLDRLLRLVFELPAVREVLARA